MKEMKEYGFQTTTHNNNKKDSAAFKTGSTGT